MAKLEMVLNLGRLRWGAAAMVAAIMCPSAFGQVVRLKAEAVAQAYADVRLGDIATVSGPDSRKAEVLANTVIISGVDRTQTVKAETVLLALLAQHGSSSVAGGLQFSGSASCEIRVAGSAPIQSRPIAAANADAAISGAPARAMASVDLDAPPTPPSFSSAPAETIKPAAPVPASPATAPASTAAGTPENLPLSKLIEAQIQQELNVPPQEVKVKIETISPLLDAPVPAGQRWLCRPLTRTLLGTVEFEAQLAEGTKVLQRLNIQTKVEQHQKAVVATARLMRGDVVSAEQMHIEDVWLDRKMPTLFLTTHDVLGLEVQRDMNVGEMLDQRDFRPALMARRSEPVNVIYKAGALQVQIRGQAMQDGKMGETIDIRNETNGDKFRAMLVGKGIAVAGEISVDAQLNQVREAK